MMTYTTCFQHRVIPQPKPHPGRSWRQTFPVRTSVSDYSAEVASAGQSKFNDAQGEVKAGWLREFWQNSKTKQEQGLGIGKGEQLRSRFSSFILHPSSFPFHPFPFILKNCRGGLDPHGKNPIMAKSC
jgi:hypothetical protein